MYKNEDGCISFCYDSDQLFNDVSLLSAYMAKSLSVGENSVVDEYSISSDEREIYNECVNQALPSICEELIKLTSFVSNAFESNLLLEFKINDNSAYNENILGLVDSTLLNCIKYSVLSEYYSICTNPTLYGLARQKFDTNLFQLKQRLFQLKKKSVSPQY